MTKQPNAKRTYGANLWLIRDGYGISRLDFIDEHRALA